jgi:flagellar basal body P-ring protein FlgI
MSNETTVKQRGRKVNENSARQIKLAIQAKFAAEGLTIKRGRKVNETSARQQRLAAFQERIENGEVVKRGRPKKVVVEA